jgi:hypothetical protein
MSRRIPFAAALAAFAVLYYADGSASKVLACLLAAALAQGSVLLVAAAELSNARWIVPLRRPLLGMLPLFLLPLLCHPDASLYAWSAHPTAWLNAGGMALRHHLFLLVSFGLAFLFARAMRAGAENRRAWAVAYIFSFVVSHSVMAVDWMMSFDYPWISTMFPALAMVEALYAGLALAGILCFVLTRRGACPPATLKDTATLTFGFALFWGGLFFAQYLTIWYGNIPEEVHYLELRFHHAGGRALFAASVLLLFAVPFFSLLATPLRKVPGAVLFLDAVVLGGLLVYRIFQVLPHAPISPLFLVLQLAALAGAGAVLMADGVKEAAAAG